MKLVYRHGIGYRCTVGCCDFFLRVLKPTVICNGILVSPLLTLDSTEHNTMKGLCKLFYMHETWHRCRGYSDFIL